VTGGEKKVLYLSLRQKSKIFATSLLRGRQAACGGDFPGGRLELYRTGVIVCLKN
jgi:hypothetical protein